MEKEERNMLLNKIEEWQEKARNEKDSFNKYLSIFIAYNIFYNLYEKTKNPGVDLAEGDSRRAIATLGLLTDSNQLFQSLRSELNRYLGIIPIFREEYWPSKKSRNREEISRELKKVFEENDSSTTIEMLLKWLYKIRCNLVHGEKSYNDEEQKELLSGSSSLLDRVLEHMMNNYREKYA